MGRAGWGSVCPSCPTHRGGCWPARCAWSWLLSATRTPPLQRAWAVALNPWHLGWVPVVRRLRGLGARHCPPPGPRLAGAGVPQGPGKCPEGLGAGGVSGVPGHLHLGHLWALSVHSTLEIKRSFLTASCSSLWPGRPGPRRTAPRRLPQRPDARVCLRAPWHVHVCCVPMHVPVSPHVCGVCEVLGASWGPPWPACCIPQGWGPRSGLPGAPARGCCRPGLGRGG